MTTLETTNEINPCKLIFNQKFRDRFQQKQQRATRTPGEIAGKIWKIHECCDSDETGNTAECQKTTFGFVWQNEAEILPTQWKMQFLQCWRRGRTRQVIFEKNIFKGYTKRVTNKFRFNSEDPCKAIKTLSSVWLNWTKDSDKIISK